MRGYEDVLISAEKGQRGSVWKARQSLTTEDFIPEFNTKRDYYMRIDLSYEKSMFVLKGNLGTKQSC